MLSNKDFTRCNDSMARGGRAGWRANKFVDASLLWDRATAARKLIDLKHFEAAQDGRTFIKKVKVPL